MIVEIDGSTRACSFCLGGKVYRSLLADTYLSTDADARMSVLNIPGISVHISAEQAERLADAGVKDKRNVLAMEK
ncbi:DUF3203 family protein [Azomonas macrocytogenes]|uniref:Uncharacterized protein n=1 Tax=Azomonas macrocytogenes TaxID=69962 RepID=A0A839TAW9_AZOMA|nr:DUF3203 family protein [Azomonas macrocytogenes]MBB3104763.1 hypothetical protein [Azomonas macrocytogenes]